MYKKNIALMHKKNNNCTINSTRALVKDEGM